MPDWTHFIPLFGKCFPDIQFVVLKKLEDGILYPNELPYNLEWFVGIDNGIYYIEVLRMSRNKYFTGLLPKIRSKQKKSEDFEITIWPSLKNTLLSSDADKNIVRYFINKYNEKYKLCDPSMPEQFYKCVFIKGDIIKGDNWGEVTNSDDYEKQEFKWKFNEDMALLHHPKFGDSSNKGSLYTLFLYFSHKNYTYKEIGTELIHYALKDNAKPYFDNFYNNYKENPKKINGGTFLYYYENDANNDYITLREKIAKLFKIKNPSETTIEELLFGFYLYHNYHKINKQFDSEKIDRFKEGENLITFISTYNDNEKEKEYNIKWPVGCERSEELKKFLKNNNYKEDEDNEIFVIKNDERIPHLSSGLYLKLRRYNLESFKERKKNEKQHTPYYEKLTFKDALKKLIGARSKWTQFALRELEEVDEQFNNKDMTCLRNYAKFFREATTPKGMTPNLLIMHDYVEFVKNDEKFKKYLEKFEMNSEFEFEKYREKFLEELGNDREKFINDRIRLENNNGKESFIKIIFDLIYNYGKYFITLKRKKTVEALKCKYEIWYAKYKEKIRRERIGRKRDEDDEEIKDTRNETLTAFDFAHYEKIKYIYKNMLFPKNDKENTLHNFSRKMDELRTELECLGIGYIEEGDDYLDFIDPYIKNIKEKVRELSGINSFNYNDLKNTFSDFRVNLAYLLNKFVENCNIEVSDFNFIDDFIDIRISTIIKELFAKDISSPIIRDTITGEIFYDENKIERNYTDLYKHILNLKDRLIDSDKYFKILAEHGIDVEDAGVKMIPDRIKKDISHIWEKIDNVYGGVPL
jgi:hypothetical protein